jgi:hypothetical protein
MDYSEQTLSQIAKHLDISPSDFKIAQGRFNAVKDWLDGGTYESGTNPIIYLQGSFRLGTVVRPYHGDKDGDYDIDQVCEISRPNQTRAPNVLKQDVGNRLKKSPNYENMLDKEGKRCWTLEYASENGRPGFHLDILPSLPAKNGAEFQIDITHKETASYSWSVSNPNGYYRWFRSKNSLSQFLVESQKREIYETNRDVYNNVNDVPKQLLRSPLQRAIQIMKRHRDVHFSGKEHKPISIIITTVVTQIYTKGSIAEIILEFTNYVRERNEALIINNSLESDGILDFDGRSWSIPNPVDQGNSRDDVENFADKWNINPALALAFFEWTRQLNRDVRWFKKSGASDDLNLRTQKFGEEDSIAAILKRELELTNEKKDGNTTGLLELIHLGIEKKMGWEFIEKVALSEVEIAKNTYNLNVTKINYYQIAKHRGGSFAESAIKDIQQILSDKQDSAAYVMCCNLLLGKVTHEMIRSALIESQHDGQYANILEWPIIRLARQKDLLPQS